MELKYKDYIINVWEEESKYLFSLSPTINFLGNNITIDEYCYLWEYKTEKEAINTAKQIIDKEGNK